MMPMLQVLADGREWSASALRGALAKRFRLTPSEVAELQPSGVQQLSIGLSAEVRSTRRLRAHDTASWIWYHAM